jgi:hypothetical protein
VAGEREALTRPCPDCHAPEGEWCDGPDGLLHLSRCRWLDARRIAPLLGVHFATLARWTRAGRIPGTQKVGSCVWYPITLIDGYRVARAETARPEEGAA